MKNPKTKKEQKKCTKYCKHQHKAFCNQNTSSVKSFYFIVYYDKYLQVVQQFCNPVCITSQNENIKK